MNVSTRVLASIMTGAIVALAIAPTGRADPAPEGANRCPVVTPEQAKSLADQLYRQGEYQSAGQCYLSAGDPTDANEAFIKALPGKSDSTAKEAQRQGKIAKALFTGVQQAFKSNH